MGQWPDVNIDFQIVACCLGSAFKMPTLVFCVPWGGVFKQNGLLSRKRESHGSSLTLRRNWDQSSPKWGTHALGSGDDALGFERK